MRLGNAKMPSSRTRNCPKPKDFRLYLLILILPSLLLIPKVNHLSSTFVSLLSIPSRIVQKHIFSPPSITQNITSQNTRNGRNQTERIGNQKKIHMGKHNAYGSDHKQGRNKKAQIGLDRGGTIGGLVVLGGALAVAGFIGAFVVRKSRKGDANKKGFSSSQHTVIPAPSSTVESNQCCKSNGSTAMNGRHVDLYEMVCSESLILEEKPATIGNGGNEREPTSGHQDILSEDDSAKSKTVCDGSRGPEEVSLPLLDAPASVEVEKSKMTQFGEKSPLTGRAEVFFPPLTAKDEVGKEEIVDSVAAGKTSCIGEKAKECHDDDGQAPDELNICLLNQSGRDSTMIENPDAKSSTAQRASAIEEGEEDGDGARPALDEVENHKKSQNAEESLMIGKPEQVAVDAENIFMQNNSTNSVEKKDEEGEENEEDYGDKEKDCSEHNKEIGTEVEKNIHNQSAEEKSSMMAKAEEAEEGALDAENIPEQRTAPNNSVKEEEEDGHEECVMEEDIEVENRTTNQCLQESPENDDGDNEQEGFCNEENATENGKEQEKNVKDQDGEESPVMVRREDADEEVEVDAENVNMQINSVEEKEEEEEEGYEEDDEYDEEDSKEDYVIENNVDSPEGTRSSSDESNAEAIWPAESIEALSLELKDVQNSEEKVKAQQNSEEKIPGKDRTREEEDCSPFNNSKGDIFSNERHVQETMELETPLLFKKEELLKQITMNDRAADSTNWGARAWLMSMGVLLVLLVFAVKLLSRITSHGDSLMY